MDFIMTEKHFVVKQAFNHHSIFFTDISKLILSTPYLGIKLTSKLGQRKIVGI